MCRNMNAIMNTLRSRTDNEKEDTYKRLEKYVILTELENEDIKDILVELVK